MKCINKFCIYYRDEKCTLDEIELDICGMCKSCIYINISKTELDRKRTEQLQGRKQLITEMAEKILDENIEAFTELSK